MREYFLVLHLHHQNEKNIIARRSGHTHQLMTLLSVLPTLCPSLVTLRDEGGFGVDDNDYDDFGVGVVVLKSSFLSSPPLTRFSVQWNESLALQEKFSQEELNFGEQSPRWCEILSVRRQCFCTEVNHTFFSERVSVSFQVKQRKENIVKRTQFFADHRWLVVDRSFVILSVCSAALCQRQDQVLGLEWLRLLLHQRITRSVFRLQSDRHFHHISRHPWLGLLLLSPWMQVEFLHLHVSVPWLLPWMEPMEATLKVWVIIIEVPNQLLDKLL